jgi:hypothetical protein
LNFVAFVTEQPNKSEPVWTGPWQKAVSKEQMLAEFEGWHETPRRMLEVRVL